jgi:hypothetical protein
MSQANNKMGFDGVVWRPIPKTKRPSNKSPKTTSDTQLYLVREHWEIEIVGLNSMGQFDLQDATIKNPTFWANMN